MVYGWVFVLLLAMGVFEVSMSFGVMTLAFVSDCEFVCCEFIFCMGVVCCGACSFVYVGCLSWFVLFDFVCWCVIVNIRWLFVRLGLLFLLCFCGVFVCVVGFVCFGACLLLFYWLNYAGLCFVIIACLGRLVLGLGDPVGMLLVFFLLFL